MGEVGVNIGIITKTGSMCKRVDYYCHFHPPTLQDSKLYIEYTSFVFNYPYLLKGKSYHPSTLLTLFHFPHSAQLENRIPISEVSLKHIRKKGFCSPPIPFFGRILFKYENAQTLIRFCFCVKSKASNRIC